MTNQTTPSHEVNQSTLSVVAFNHLKDTLTKRGNLLSSDHAEALQKLMELFAGYVAGSGHGRKAFPLPTGMGKTTGVVSFIVALHRLGYRVPVAVAASQVQALITLKAELVAAGVPEADIGLAHRDSKAIEPSTGCRPEDGRLIQLVTHARVRMADSYLGLFAEFQDQPRRLLIYDEALFRSAAFAFLAVAVESALGALAPYARSMPALDAPVEYLSKAMAVINDALEKSRAMADPLNRGIPVELPELHIEVIELWKEVIATSKIPRAFVEVLNDLLNVSQQPLQVLPMTQGGGAVAVRQTVSDQLSNVVVLDASTPIRELVALDPTISVYRPLLADLKSFKDVEVMQLLAAGGRSSIEQSFTDMVKETSTVSREVVDIVKEELVADDSRCVLLFTFKKSLRSDLDIKMRLFADLKLAGVDPDELVQTEVGLKPRCTFLHWGQHEGLNGYEYCKTVILAGVLHRAHLDIAANIKGQKFDLSAPTPHDMVTKVIKSEIAHCVYQAASRGSCRRVTLGKANAMRLWLIHSDAGLKDALAKVMPYAQWSYPAPRHIKFSNLGAVRATMRGRILQALRDVSDDVSSLSVQAFKKTMGLETNETTKRAYTRAITSLDLSTHGWTVRSRRLVRATAAAYGFT